jgi:hypothetical protein
MPRPAWPSILLFVLPYVARMAGVCHCTQPLVEMAGVGLMNFLPRLALNHDPSDLCLPSS